MSEHTSTHDDTASTDTPLQGLSPSVRSIVSHSLPARDRSLAAALCTIAGEAASASDERTGGRPAQSLEPVTKAAVTFEGYARIRLDLLATDRYDRENARDAAVLASDYLHAAAYTMAAETAVPDRRSLELYRILTEGSTTLAALFFERVPESSASSPDVSAHPDVVLAETASALGATAVGATTETRAAIERYARGLTAALIAHPDRTDEPHRTAIGALSGTAERPETDEVGPETSQFVRFGDDRPSTVERHLERARDAIETLRRTQLDTRSDAESMFARLEGATRIPFDDVLENDG
ncbi:hypothetical protein [Natrarchaeobius chitinivorans]|uniref:Polyprenyl synthetase n=1 Tax=Natrarchaeobius chitinivorans TaxID=1679083 RepID=A0A3N6LVH3_NATCH|nr:hypothetical protein [Natrarchaeobius chitinivorans]RQG94433.1 hypothetical protein EA473_12085 [Natrarchaeobius chitinivorans]